MHIDEELRPRGQGCPMSERAAHTSQLEIDDAILARGVLEKSVGNREQRPLKPGQRLIAVNRVRMRRREVEDRLEMRDKQSAFDHIIDGGDPHDGRRFSGSRLGRQMSRQLLELERLLEHGVRSTLERTPCSKSRSSSRSWRLMCRPSLLPENRRPSCGSPPSMM